MISNTYYSISNVAGQRLSWSFQNKVFSSPEQYVDASNHFKKQGNSTFHENLLSIPDFSGAATNCGTFLQNKEFLPNVTVAKQKPLRLAETRVAQSSYRLLLKRFQWFWDSRLKPVCCGSSATPGRDQPWRIFPSAWTLQVWQFTSWQLKILSFLGAWLWRRHHLCGESKSQQIQHIAMIC